MVCGVSSSNNSPLLSNSSSNEKPFSTQSSKSPRKFLKERVRVSYHPNKQKKVLKSFVSVEIKFSEEPIESGDPLKAPTNSLMKDQKAFAKELITFLEKEKIQREDLKQKLSSLGVDIKKRKLIQRKLSDSVLGVQWEGESSFLLSILDKEQFSKRSQQNLSLSEDKIFKKFKIQDLESKKKLTNQKIKAEEAKRNLLSSLNTKQLKIRLNPEQAKDLSKDIENIKSNLKLVEKKIKTLAKDLKAPEISREESITSVDVKSPHNPSRVRSPSISDGRFSQETRTSLCRIHGLGVVLGIIFTVLTAIIFSGPLGIVFPALCGVIAIINLFGLSINLSSKDIQGLQSFLRKRLYFWKKEETKGSRSETQTVKEVKQTLNLEEQLLTLEESALEQEEALREHQAQLKKELSNLLKQKERLEEGLVDTEHTIERLERLLGDDVFPYYGETQEQKDLALEKIVQRLYAEGALYEVLHFLLTSSSESLENRELLLDKLFKSFPSEKAVSFIKRLIDEGEELLLDKLFKSLSLEAAVALMGKLIDDADEPLRIALKNLGHSSQKESCVRGLFCRIFCSVLDKENPKKEEAFVRVARDMVPFLPRERAAKWLSEINVSHGGGDFSFGKDDSSFISALEVATLMGQLFSSQGDKNIKHLFVPFLFEVCKSSTHLKMPPVASEERKKQFKRIFLQGSLRNLIGSEAISYMMRDLVQEVVCSVGRSSSEKWTALRKLFAFSEVAVKEDILSYLALRKARVDDEEWQKNMSSLEKDNGVVNAIRFLFDSYGNEKFLKRYPNLRRFL